MPRVTLTVGGMAYEGWKTVQVTRGIEAASGKFDLDVSEKWSLMQPWPIRPGDECTVAIDGTVVITGYVDERRVSYDHQSHSLKITGRDKAGDLIDSSAALEGDKWELVKQPADRIVSEICRRHGIGVKLEDGVSLPPPQDRFPINPGETAFEAIDRICRLSGVLPVSDGQGGLLLTRSGSQRISTALVEGQNILSAEASFTQSGRFSEYRVMGQHPGSDDFYGDPASEVVADALDENVRPGRLLIVRPEGIVTLKAAEERAAWEAIVRSARAGQVSVKVQGWQQQPGGALWEPNKLVRLRSPMLGIDAEMLITQITYSIDTGSGTTAKLALKRPEAYTPRTGGGGGGKGDAAVPAKSDPWSEDYDLDWEWDFGNG
ncbi:hypothetical protein HW532_15720 [Kaustia mangrovi]|uniref:Baseplate protein n=1 Tax=Kaustia mangrovi TaxID=2593653 RepID=A0A7S8HCW5_9HYPH|nr:contractile injection system protein, VgrG/Pvc8 family [Kaustia mangrovi]QPC44010.1 hypothetical protein HW532_15720 [Kaustia mangrovi]